MFKFYVPSILVAILSITKLHVLSIAQVLENFTLSSHNLTVHSVDKFWGTKARYNQYFTNYFSIRFHGTQLLYQVLKKL